MEKIKLKLVYVLSKIKGEIGKLERVLVSSFTLISIAILIGATVILVSFTAVQVQTPETSVGLFKDISDWTLSLIGVSTDKLTSESYRDKASIITGVVAVLVTLWFSVVTSIKYFNGRVESKRRSPFKNIPVYIDGIDDLNIMYNHYKAASKVTVFSGDFSWVCRHEKLKEVVLKLLDEHKIFFVSYKNEASVKAAISDDAIFEKIKPRTKFDSGLEIKCSLVQEAQSSAFLYKVDRTFEGGDKNVCIINGRDETRYLMSALSNLIEPHLKF